MVKEVRAFECLYVCALDVDGTRISFLEFFFSIYSNGFVGFCVSRFSHRIDYNADSSNDFNTVKLFGCLFAFQM